MKKRNKGIKKKKKKLIHNVCILERGKNGNNKLQIRQFIQNTHIVNPDTL